MYREVQTDAVITLANGSNAHPVVTLADEHGGRAQIIVDDHCYVLALRNPGGAYVTVKHWFQEAVHAIRHRPGPMGEES